MPSKYLHSSDGVRETYTFKAGSKPAETILNLVLPSFPLKNCSKLPPEMHELVWNFNLAVYHIEPGATAVISSNIICAADLETGGYETSISICCKKEKDRNSAKSTLEKYLGFEF